MRGAWLGSVVALALAAGVLSPAAAAPPGPLVPRGEHLGGHTYEEWAVAGWQWELAHLTIPRGGPDPAACVIGDQPAQVWFLGASFDRRSSVTGDCAIPLGRYVLVTSPSIDCSTVQPPPFHAAGDAALVRCARAGWRAAQARHRVILDGQPLTPPGFVVATPAFVFAMPTNDNYLGVPGARVGRAAAFGYADMLRPLSRGTHTLVRVTQYAGHAPLRTTWHLVVG